MNTMANVTKSVVYWYENMEAQYADPRIKSYFMMDTPVIMLITLASYISFVKFFGPKYMENRKPLKLTEIIRLYNIAQVTCNIYLIYALTKCLWLTDTYRYNCIEVNYSENLTSRELITVVWIFYMSRVLDLLDTIFFVLRKKTRQISFLHVYHHSFVFFSGWLITKIVPGGQIIFFGTINSFVHAIMYGYYFFSSFNVDGKMNFWWKKYVTQIQLVQFICCALQAFSQLCSRDCKYPNFMLWFGLSQNIFMFFLFSNFYVRTYWKSKPKAL